MFILFLWPITTIAVFNNYNAVKTSEDISSTKTEVFINFMTDEQTGRTKTICLTRK